MRPRISRTPNPDKPFEQTVQCRKPLFNARLGASRLQLGGDPRPDVQRLDIDVRLKAVPMIPRETPSR
jgi:hypothetical protein